MLFALLSLIYHLLPYRLFIFVSSDKPANGLSIGFVGKFYVYNWQTSMLLREVCI